MSENTNISSRTKHKKILKNNRIKKLEEKKKINMKKRKLNTKK